jgi:hypothetical protein
MMSVTPLQMGGLLNTSLPIITQQSTPRKTNLSVPFFKIGTPTNGIGFTVLFFDA